MNEQFILKSLQKKLDIIGNSVMSEQEIQKAFTADELNLIEKAKYIRREGTKGNYKYIYEEPKRDGKFKQIKGDEVWGEKWRKKSKEEIQKEIEYIKKELKDNPSNIGKTNENFERKLDYLNELLKQSEKKEEKHPGTHKMKVDEDDLKGYSDYKIQDHKDSIDEHLEKLKNLKTEKEKEHHRHFIEIHKELLKRKTPDFKDAPHFQENLRKYLSEIDSKLKEQSEKKKSLDSDIEKSESTSKEKKVAKVMTEFKAGTLKTSSGEVVTDRDQAIAIALSEAGLSKD